MFFWIEVPIFEISFRNIVFIEDVSSMIEFVFILGSLGLLDRIFDRRDRRDGENNILKIDVLCIIFPQLMELWMTGYVTESTFRCR